MEREVWCLFGEMPAGHWDRLDVRDPDPKVAQSLLREPYYSVAELMQLLGLSHRYAWTASDPVESAAELGRWWTVHGRDAFSGDRELFTRLATRQRRFIDDLKAFCVAGEGELLWLLDPEALIANPRFAMTEEDVEVGRALVPTPLKVISLTESNPSVDWVVSHARDDVASADVSLLQSGSFEPFAAVRVRLTGNGNCSTGALTQMEWVRLRLAESRTENGPLVLRLAVDS